jgi:lipopolysaccharide transport system permease protein
LRLRYRQTALGAAWVVLQPLLGALIFTFVFGVIAKLPSDGNPYLLFAFTALAGWNLFAGILTRSASSLIQNSALIAKVWFPRSVIPCATLPGALVDLLATFAVLVVFFVWYGRTPGAVLLTLPLWILLLVVLALGAGLGAAALMVSYRDVQHVLPVLVQLLLYASPVGYAASSVPGVLGTLYYLNPLAAAIDGLRWSVLGTPPPPVAAVGYAVAMAVLGMTLGLWLFRRMERRFADVI